MFIWFDADLENSILFNRLASNYMKYTFLFLFFIPLTNLGVHAQEDHGSVTGEVLGFDGRRDIPLVGSNVSWLGTTFGTTADLEGNFHLDFPLDFPATLIVSFVGYESYSLVFKEAVSKHLKVKLELGKTLSVVEIRERLEASRLSFSSDFYQENLSKKELQKAACCNLSESFETNASIDVQAADAVSGAKRIQMLGLDGIYSQMQFEGIPWIRGLSGNTGLSFIPGTWVEGIQVSKGSGSVTMGYESITGQINIETFKPDGPEENVHLNLYGSAMGRLETNLRLKSKLSDKWSTILLVHADVVEKKNDFNSDGFLDMPLRRDIHVFNRWKYSSERWRFQFGAAALAETQTGGQLDFKRSDTRNTNYGVGSDIEIFDVFAKGGYLFPNEPYRSVAFLAKYRHMNQESFYGLNNYTGVEDYGFLKGIYQGIFRTTIHTYRAGASMVWNQFDEQFVAESFERTEYVPGAFFEYSYKPSEKLTWVSGLRIDAHNLFGIQPSPRTHLKYAPNEKTTFRISAGRGFRAPNALMENSGFFVSSRRVFRTANLEAESGWNMGAVVSRRLVVFGRESTFSLDYFHTEFENQLVTDLETPGELYLYNLDGRSHSEAVQLEWQVEPFKRFRAKLAAKYYEVRTNYRGQMRARPLIPKFRGLANFEYEIVKDKWMLDATLNYIGVSRLPSTASNLAENQRSDHSLDYVLLSSQLRRNGKNIDVYVGAENLLNYKQKNAIVSADQAFSPEFDASMVWAPVNGRVLYLGLDIKF
uniref:TonB-dependent outer membrane receptor protein n=1 Tax=uncultured Flavobacteriia bacterium TaxID=212695 RepID=H6RFX4_9BACT|nr:TonB-dependent outer membrane receptor protein [uncultured Flavobacteriia bacterium]